jgi:Flp pilus assembly pilin Flp
MYDNRRASGESGQTSAEYAVMMTVISVGIITALSVMSGTVATLVTSAATAL